MAVEVHLPSIILRLRHKEERLLARNEVKPDKGGGHITVHTNEHALPTTFCLISKPSINSLNSLKVQTGPARIVL